MSIFNFVFSCVWLTLCLSPSQSWLQLGSINRQKAISRQSFSLYSVVEAGEGFGQYKREKGGKSNRSTGKAKGFSKPWDKVEPLIPIITGDMPCACNSGKIYQECCELHHTNSFTAHSATTGEEASETPVELAAGSPEGILRARYTAYKHGNSDYIIDTTHPTSDDYLKFVEEAQASLKSGKTRWAKEILQMSEDYEYLGLEIVNSKISKNKQRATVLFRALFKKGNAYMAVEENAIFLGFKGAIKEGFSGRTVYSKDGKNPINTAPVSDKFDTASNAVNKWSATDASSPIAPSAAKEVDETIRWLFFDSETTEPAEEIAQKMVEEWPLRPENDKNSDGRNKGKAATEKEETIVLGGSAPAEVSKNLKRPPLRRSSAGLKAEVRAIPMGKGRA